MAFEPCPGFAVRMAATSRGICRLLIGAQEDRSLGRLIQPQELLGEDDPLLDQAARQLEEYFLGRRREFQLPLDLRGTCFQKTVWDALQRIPFGETRSYAGIARQVGSPRAVRAVGRANGANPVPIIVPCHRVVASGGGLGGYGGGLDCKRRLLALESGAPDGLFGQT